jgi:hypothetical protein
MVHRHDTVFTMLGRLAAMAMFVSLPAVGACYSPPEPDCGFVCGPAGECPEDYTCDAAEHFCHRNGTPSTLICAQGGVPFDIQSVTSTGTHVVTVTFDSAPDPTSAAVAANYMIQGLTITGSPVVSGATITLMTTAQDAIAYTLTVSNVTRATDGSALTTATGMFTGVPAFVIASASSVNAHAIAVTYSAAPNASQAVDLANYNVPNLTLSGTPALSGNTVTLATSGQAMQTYTVTVTGVKRASDFEPLDTATAMFTGHLPYQLASAVPQSTVSLVVTFSAAPNVTQATTLGNYTINGLTLSGTPVLAGSAVTLTTATQSAIMYTLDVANVARASDGEPLSVGSISFTGVACNDGMQDGDETDTDCGGANCAACGDGKHCLVNADCVSNNCATGNVCMP